MSLLRPLFILLVVLSMPIFIACTDDENRDLPTQMILVEPDAAAELLGWRLLVPISNYALDGATTVEEFEDTGPQSVRQNYREATTGESIDLAQGPRMYLFLAEVRRFGTSNEVLGSFEVEIGAATDRGETWIATFPRGC